MSLQRLRMVSDLINREQSQYSLLDLGCRTMELKPLLKGCVDYKGTDFTAAEGVLPCNLEEPLDFETGSFDIVCALDVLEHLEHCHQALTEAIRVARKQVIISLPNMFYATFRLNFLRGYNISGKYTFPMEPILDRHRWLLSRDDAMNFIDHNAQGLTVQHIDIVPERGRTRLVSAPIEKMLARRYPNMFVYGVISVIDVSKK